MFMMMKKTVLILILVIHYAGYTNCQDKYISSEKLREWVMFLSSDEMKGRSNGSPEMLAAASWIESKFRESGLLPLPGHQGYIQKYSFMSRSINVNEQNVIGYIEGSDPNLKDEYIVLSAHFDHIGIRRGNPTDSIMNGADDNAAGTATITGIAEYIKKSGAKPGRSLIFAAFSGEELGMRGSRHFVANSPVDIIKIHVNMNFEMTGHSEELGKKRYYMTGCSFSDLDDQIKEFSRKSGFMLVDTLRVANMLFNASDNVAFSRISVRDGITTGIPSGTFATSTIADHVHSVDDEAEFFDFENMAALVNHFAEVVIWLSTNPKEVNWTNAKMKRPE
jgi:bacterial leucyl aminopeptidase